MLKKGQWKNKNNKNNFLINKKFEPNGALSICFLFIFSIEFGLEECKSFSHLI